MALSEYEYKVLDVTVQLNTPNGVDLLLDSHAKLGWDVQQMFTRWVGSDTERVCALLQRSRNKNPNVPQN